MKKVNNKTVLDGLFLFNVSEEHRLYSIWEFMHYFVYPLMYDKVRIYYEDGKPVALFTYVFLSHERAEEFLNGDIVLDEQDYAADDGDELWGIEFIAPYGHIRKVFADIKQEYSEKYGKPRPFYYRRLHKPFNKRRGKL
jgi:hemolysin-activating ACP:hemolysin acyltransferase